MSTTDSSSTVYTSSIGSLNSTTSLAFCYVGCFVDNIPRDLPLGILSSSSLTIELCTTSCLNSGYLYAGVQTGLILIEIKK